MSRITDLKIEIETSILVCFAPFLFWHDSSFDIFWGMQLGARNLTFPTNRTHSSFDIEFPIPQTNKKEISIQSLVIFLGYHKQDKMYFCFLTILN